MKNPEILLRTKQTLTNIPGLGKVTWRYALIVAGVNLVVLLADIIVTYLSGFFSGLSGIGIRSALGTISSMVLLISAFLLPFLSFGHMNAALRSARGFEPTNNDLLHGFRRFGPLLRLTLLRFCIYMLIIPAAVNIGTIFYFMIPGSADTLTSLQNFAVDPNAMTDPVLAMTLLKAVWPMYLLIFGLMFALMLPVSYRLRLADWAILDGENKAFRAMLYSNRSMRRNCWQLFRLDLWQWEFYLLTAVASVISLGDQLLGLTSPWAYWLVTLLSIGLQLLINAVFLSRVNTAYATFYLYKFHTEPVPQPPVQQF